MAVPRSITSGLVSRLARGDVPQVEIPKVLSTIFDATDYKYSIEHLPEQDLETWVERLDQVYLL